MVKNQYINNQTFLTALIERRALVKMAEDAGLPPPKISNYLGECIMLICEKLSTSGKFRSYSYLDEMVADALEKCCGGIDVFDPTRVAPRSGKINPFAFFTQIAWNAFIYRIEIEKKQNAIKHNNAVQNYTEFLTSNAVMFSGSDIQNLAGKEATEYVLKEYEEKQKIKREKAKKKK
jgi:hypothetical protein